MVGNINPGTLANLSRSIGINRSSVNDSLSQISSGKRLIRAGIDASGLAISEKLNSEITALGQSVKNIENGSRFIGVAEGGLATISDMLTRGRELAIQAGNGTLGKEARSAIDLEFQQIKSEIDRLSGSQEFNGQKLLDGSLSPDSKGPIKIQVGTGSTPSDQISLNVIDEISTESLKIDQSSLTSQNEALKAMESFDQAQQIVTSARGQVGALANRLEISARNAQTTSIGLEESLGKIAGVDVAEAFSQLKSGLSQTELSLKAQAISLKQNETQAGKLLNISV